MGLLEQDPLRRAVDERFGNASRTHESGQRLAVAAGRGQLDVDPGGQRQRAGRAARPGDAVPGLQEGDGVVVGDDDTAEAELAPEQPGQQRFVGGAGTPSTSV